MAWIPRRRALRVTVLVAIVIVVVVGAWVVWASLVIFGPTVSAPRAADAIIVVGPSLDPRIEQADELARQLGVPEVVLSVGDTAGQVVGLCGSAPDSGDSALRPAAPANPEPGTTSSRTCYIPQPYNTRGDARAIGRIARLRGWTDILVIAARPQLSRAELLIKRCYSGTLQMVVAAGTENDGWNFYDALHQTGGFIEAATSWSC